jgi:hypothetical protein
MQPMKSTPKTIGVTDPIYYTCTFLGVSCTPLQIASWEVQRIAGKCPWCRKTFRSDCDGLNKHLRACADKPSPLKTTDD